MEPRPAASGNISMQQVSRLRDAPLYPTPAYSNAVAAPSGAGFPSWNRPSLGYGMLPTTSIVTMTMLGAVGYFETGGNCTPTRTYRKLSSLKAKRRNSRSSRSSKIRDTCPRHMIRPPDFPLQRPISVVGRLFVMGTLHIPTKEVLKPNFPHCTLGHQVSCTLS
ncbi:hypothetical protein BDY21DRAFT_116543 [Lineolata rhizophorae]|uniref:Uncharacterized protein n=1 Tax=Lineolata rhizophorae TaxID=578093 RepID=A0A6A6NQL6_9PEZI|nr:hypothetical protein BDY21DRAFT_116543 [Lineolata rhizophorae]